jgi:MFS family permease
MLASPESIFGEDAAVLRDRSFQLLLLATMLPPLGSAIISPILDSLIDPLGTTPVDVGLMISLFTAPAIVFIPIAGGLGDRYGRKPVLFGSLLMFGVAGVAIAFTTDFQIVLALRALQGLGFSGILPMIITSVGDLYGDRREITAQGIRFAGSGLTATVFPVLSGLLVALAWQYPFFLYGISIPIALAIHLWFHEPEDIEANEGRSDGFQVHRLLAVLIRPRVAATVLGRSLPIIIWIGLITYNSIVVVRVLGASSAAAGLVVALGSFAYAASASQAGRLTKLLGSQLRVLVSSNLVLAAGFALFLLAPNVPAASIGALVLGFGFGLLLTLYRSLITGLGDISLRGSIVGVSEAADRIIATATPLLMSVGIALAESSMGLAGAVQAAGLAVATISTLGGLLCLLVMQRRDVL